MDLMNKPSKIYFLHPLRRYVGGKPQIHTIGWFRDHVFWHKNTVVDADNISFWLNEDPGQKGVISDGVEIWMEGCSTPTMSCASYGKRLHTLATVRRDELCIRYEHGTLNLPDYPFPTVSFTFTRRFLKLLHPRLPPKRERSRFLCLNSACPDSGGSGFLRRGPHRPPARR